MKRGQRGGSRRHSKACGLSFATGSAKVAVERAKTNATVSFSLGIASHSCRCCILIWGRVHRWYVMRQFSGGGGSGGTSCLSGGGGGGMSCSSGGGGASCSSGGGGGVHHAPLGVVACRAHLVVVEHCALLAAESEKMKVDKK